MSAPTEDWPRMVVDIERKAGGIYLQDAGCGCCSSMFLATTENTTTAIGQLERLLEELRSTHEHHSILDKPKPSLRRARL